MNKKRGGKAKRGRNNRMGPRHVRPSPPPVNFFRGAGINEGSCGGRHVQRTRRTSANDNDLLPFRPVSCLRLEMARVRRVAGTTLPGEATPNPMTNSVGNFLSTLPETEIDLTSVELTSPITGMVTTLTSGLKAGCKPR